MLHRDLKVLFKKLSNGMFIFLTENMHPLPLKVKTFFCGLISSCCIAVFQNCIKSKSNILQVNFKLKLMDFGRKKSIHIQKCAKNDQAKRTSVPFLFFFLLLTLILFSSFAWLARDTYDDRCFQKWDLQMNTAVLPLPLRLRESNQIFKNSWIA